MQQPEVVESAFTAATTGAQRAINDLNINIMKKVDEIYVDKTCQKSTITNLYGINKNFDSIDGERAPTQDNESQTIILKVIAHTQTDEGSFVTADHHYYN
jgi:hypothetical protein